MTKPNPPRWARGKTQAELDAMPDMPSIGRIPPDQSKTIETTLTWHPATDLPPRDADEMMSPRTLLLILAKDEWIVSSRPMHFGRYSHGLRQWRIDGSLTGWDVSWWAELPEVPGGESR